MSASEKLKALDGAATPSPWWSDNPGDVPEGWILHSPDEESRGVDGSIIAALRNALPQIVAVVEAAEKAAAKQQEALAIIRDNGFVFDGPLGAEPGNWENLAFSLYTDLCEIESHTGPALNALEEALGGDVT